MNADMFVKVSLKVDETIKVFVIFLSFPIHYSFFSQGFSLFIIFLMQFSRQMYTEDDLFAFRVNIIRRMLENVMPIKDTPVKKTNPDESPEVKEINGSEMPPQKKRQKVKVRTRRRILHLEEEEEETIDESLQDSDTEPQNQGPKKDLYFRKLLKLALKKCLLLSLLFKLL